MLSQISFAVAHDLLITCFSKSNLSSVQRVQHVLHEGYSIDSTHTEPFADRLSHGLRTFDEFVTTALQHNLLTGKGGFAVSFYVLLKNATAAKAKVPTYRRVRKLLCKQSLLVMHRRLCLPSLCLISFLCQSDCNIQHHPQRVVTTSLCYCSEFPIPVTPLSSCRAPND